ncbi:LamG domain-containing protein [Paenibacillus sp. WQ 127069]|uniref:LamG domain-containing protein n=2 Tax=Paenibacillus baimaensis TaxID=2982185 RepID=A0ABT2UD87_9BACL|nr:LamG domain-containing protein [Paenibacillus sp. WQ 127069]
MDWSHVMANSVETNYNYGDNGRLRSVESKNGDGEYQYDANGNLIKRIKERESFNFGGTRQLPLPNLAVSTGAGARNTVEFWMYWDGTQLRMPLGWDTLYDLIFMGGYFGFNTGNDDVLGIPSASLKERWVHVAAVFYNGIPDAIHNELYIDGVKQNIVQGVGTTSSHVTVTPQAYISGWGIDNLYRFTGRISDVRIWNYALSPIEVQANRTKTIIGNEPGLAGRWNLTENSSPPSSLGFTGSQVPLPNLDVNTTAGSKNTVEFWMNWDGSDVRMPIGWNTGYDLIFLGGYFGFNTSSADVLGIPSASLKNKWVHVAAVFYNGVPSAANNELYIDGIKQNLVQGLGITTAYVTVTPNAYISGWGFDGNYRFIGRMGEVRIWNYALTTVEVQSNRYKTLTGKEPGLVGNWKLRDTASPKTSLSFDGSNQVPLPNLAVNTTVGGKNTVEFWMNWDGGNVKMPVGWNTGYDLIFLGGNFGFNTGASDVLGISSDNLLNKWVHVAAVFYNGVPDAAHNELYINGVKQAISQRMGTTAANVAVTPNAYISGWGPDGGYRFTGRISDVRIWSYALTAAEVQSNQYRSVSENESGLAGHWTLSDTKMPGTSLSFDGTNQSRTA